MTLLKPNVRVALVGCGGLARRYRQAYRAIEGVTASATIDVNEEEARAAAAETGAARASQDFAEALRPDVNAVVITTPNHLHCEQATQALDAGKHVLLQKPMARTVIECDEILDAQRRSDATLGLYMNLLDHPQARYISGQVFTVDGGTAAVGCYSFETFKRQETT